MSACPWLLPILSTPPTLATPNVQRAVWMILMYQDTYGHLQDTTNEVTAFACLYPQKPC